MLNLIPTIGLNGIEFGDSVGKIETDFGIPDEVNLIDQYEVMEYFKKGVALYLDMQSKLLEKIEIEETEVAVWGSQLMFESPATVQKIIELNTDAEIVIVDKPVPSLFYCVESLGVDFYFESKKLTTITARKP